MADVRCSCGRTFDAPPGDAICPGCGSITEVREEKIGFNCTCGKALAAPARLAGKRVICPACKRPASVPAPEAAAVPASPSPRTMDVPAPPPATDGWRHYGRWGLALALLPLVLSVFTPNDNVRSRLQHMIEADPSLAKKLEKAESKSELMDALPDHRIEGSFHSGDTMAHWLYALLSAGVFWGLILLLYPLGKANSKQIWTAGIFTGTVGIFLLLGFQYVAAWTQGSWIHGRSIIVLIFYIVKFIGFSYRAALDPENGFLLSMLGFTFGVGLCEELCKALPLLWHYRRAKTAQAALDVRGAVVWGLAAGIGFGVSEGITYSSDHYNGITTGGIYVVRFVSCVALHAVWSAVNALFLYRSQAEFDAIGEWYGWFLPILKTLGLSMVLHGLYDTLLKRDMEIGALLAAVVSFALFFWLYERAVREEARLAPATA